LIHARNFRRRKTQFRFSIATKSDHYIMLRQPGLVIGAVRDVVGAVRAVQNHVSLRD
jgi:hypothetical protein